MQISIRNVAARATIGVIIGLLSAAPAVADTPTGFWTPVGAPPFGATFPTAAVLSNGKVVLAGGASSSTNVLQASVLYDPASDGWSGVTPTVDTRFGATAVTLKSGKILVVGGRSSLSSTSALNTGEVYNPATNTWTAVTNQMSSARASDPVAQLLPSGQVLVAGGADATGASVASADLYDPASNAFTPAHAMGTPRAQPAFALLPGGTVLVAGGNGNGNALLSSAEVYDPASNTWTSTSNPLSVPRGLGVAAVALPNGRVLVIGGLTHISPTSTTATTDIYNPATNSFTPGASMHSSRTYFASASLPDGRVLVAGGEVVENGSPPTVTSAAELYDPASDAWRLTDSLPNPSAAPATVVLPSGQALVIDGAPDANSNNTLLMAAEFTAYTRPTAPLSVSATAGIGSAVVTFAPPASSGGVPVQSYTVTSSSGQSLTTPDARTAVTFTGLTPGRPVSFTVLANNALGAGAASTPSNQVTPVPSSLPPDRAPRLTISKLKTKLKLKTFLNGVTFTVAADKPASLQISLVGSVDRATIARALNLTLASSRLGPSGRPRTVTLTPNKALVGRPRTATIGLVLVATDAADSRSTTTRTIHVSR